MRGVADTLTLVLLISVVVTVGYLTYTFVSSILSSLFSANQTSTTLLSPIDIKWVDYNKFIVRNLGQKDVNVGNMWVSDENLIISCNRNEIGPREFAVCTVSGETSKEEIVIAPEGAVSRTVQVPEAFRRKGSWLVGYAYRRPVVITTSMDLNDYQVLVILDTSSLISNNKMRPDCGDIRFTLEDGVTKIPYWIESGCGTANTKLWVKVPEINSPSTTIYLYYGKSDAASESNVDAVFVRRIVGLVMALHFDEGSGTIAYDTSGNGNNGQIYGAKWVTAKFGYGLEFDGTDDYVEVNASPTLEVNNNKFSVVVWYYPYTSPAASDYRALVIKQTSSAGGYGILVDNNQTRCHFYIDDPVAGVAWLYTALPTETNTWHFATGTYDKNYSGGDNMYFYFDTIYNHQLIDYNVGGAGLPVYIGGDPVNQSFATAEFNGIIDEVYIFNRLVEGIELWDLYTNRGYSTPSLPGILLVRKYSSPEPTVAIGQEEQIA